MKIFSIINNYDDAEEGEALFGAGLSWYEMPDSSVLRSGNPFFVPDFDDTFLAFPSIVYRIGRLGKSIAVRFAGRYVEAAGIAVAVVAAGRLKALRKAGMPWSQAVSFDRSCFLGNLQPIDTFINNNEVITLNYDNAEMRYETGRLRNSPAEIIHLLSRNSTLKNGDLILAGLTAKGLTLTPGTKLTARHETSNINLIDINIK